jgi:hypothetical protein
VTKLEMTIAGDCRRNRIRPPAPFAVARVLLFVALASLAGAAVSMSSDPAADSTGGADSSAITATVTLPPPDERVVLPSVAEPFRPGESLRFSVQYGFIHAGSAYLEVPRIAEWEGHPAYTLVARAESNAFFSRFYKVRNRIESVWDKQGQYSWRYYEDRREGGYRERSEILFDHARGEARYSDGQTFPIPPRVQDALSSFYYTRFQALPIGGSVVFDYHASHKSQPLEVRVIGRDRVSTPAGTFNCVVIEPVLKAGGIFKNKGRLVIWLTDDERRMPVMMKSKVAIGSISVILQQARAGV